MIDQNQSYKVETNDTEHQSPPNQEEEEEEEKRQIHLK